jgi:hypothetical protein
MTSAQADDAESRDLRYQVRLLIRHPAIDPDRITSKLGLTPHLSAMVGSVRKNPRGLFCRACTRTACGVTRFAPEEIGASSPM